MCTKYIPNSLAISRAPSGSVATLYIGTAMSNSRNKSIAWYSCILKWRRGTVVFTADRHGDARFTWYKTPQIQCRYTVFAKHDYNKWALMPYYSNVCLCQYSIHAFVHMTLTFDIWPWKPFKQCRLTWWIFVASFRIRWNLFKK